MNKKLLLVILLILFFSLQGFFFLLFIFFSVMGIIFEGHYDNTGAFIASAFNSIALWVVTVLLTNYFLPENPKLKAYLLFLFFPIFPIFKPVSFVAVISIGIILSLMIFWYFNIYKSVLKKERKP
jgi:hypothetical protein